jgi:DNA-binding MarR family transcriptional regulator
MENPQDRRSFQLFLSTTGETLYKEVNKEYQDYIQSLVSKLNEDQLEQFAEVSGRFEQRLVNAN